MRIIILSLMAVLCSTLLFAAEAETNPLQKYMAEPNVDNLKEAIDVYQQKLEAEEWDAAFYLAYLFNLELNKSLQTLDENFDELGRGFQFAFANFLADNNRAEESLPYYQQLADAYPDWSCVWRHRAEALYNTGNYEDAEQSAEQSIRADEEHFDAYIMLAKIQHELGKDAEALKTLETAFQYEDEEDESGHSCDVDMREVNYLYLELLRKNGREADYQKLKSELEKDCSHNDSCN